MLSDAKIRSAKPGDKPYKLGDSNQLYLFVSPTGGKLWRMNYAFFGKQKSLSFGPYPLISLADARKMRDVAKLHLLAGNDPGGMKRREQEAQREDSANSFETVARRWFDINKLRWAKVHSYDVIHSLERDVFPKIGTLPIRHIKAPTVLGVLQQIEARPAIETAKRIGQRISAVFVYAIATGAAETDPAAMIGRALKPMPPRKKRPALLDLDCLRQMICDAEAVPAHPVTRLALRLLALTAVRPSELRGASWEEFGDLDAEFPIWCIPALRMKGTLARKNEEGGDHLVPLSVQAIGALKVLQTLTGNGSLAFPSICQVQKPMSENAIGYLLNRSGYHGRHVPHGWRAAFSTIMNEWAKSHGRADDREVIDLMLAHIPHNKVEGAYNRASYLGRRRELSQIWGAMLMQDLAPPEALIAKLRK